ncbi:nutritionally-regulated adipose and cardiac enriched protein homolog [Tenrec ecaudatus]|uniref:nutritionally-regulated adipose and cardiac enriched protein homolog n=1 Tax=Tenrec ecaudatus TaxID=94439 RepID=UPI003F5AB91A
MCQEMRTSVHPLRSNCPPEMRRQAKRDSKTSTSMPGPRPEQESRGALPPSILRCSQPEASSGAEGSRRGRRRVRFREPLEAAVHYVPCRDRPTTTRGSAQSMRPTPQRGGSLLLWLVLCVLLAMALGLCCGHTKPMALALQDLRARAVVLVLRLQHAASTFWQRLLQL